MDGDHVFFILCGQSVCLWARIVIEEFKLTKSKLDLVISLNKSLL